MYKKFFRNLLIIIVLLIVYFVSAKLGLKLAFVNASATAVWPPTGIAIASLLLFGFKVWPGIFLGAFFANVTTAGTILTSIGIATGNTLEGVVGAYLVGRFANGRFAFDTPQDIFKFAILAGIISPVVSATIGVTSLFLGGFASSESLLPIWFTWWLGDLGGALIIAPLILIWSNKPKISWRPKRIAEALLIAFILLLVSWIIFREAKSYPIDFLIFPILLLVAFRFGVREIVTATTVLSAIAIWGTLSGRGPFARESQNESLLLLQSFIAVVTISKAIVASVVAQGRELDKLKDEFVSLASHQLRTPLTTIKWYTEMLMAGGVGNVTSKQADYLSEVYKGNQRMINLVNDLLDVSRIARGTFVGKPEQINIKEMVGNILEDLKLQISDKQLDIHTSYQGKMEIKMDPKIIRLILQNLLSNSIKYTNMGGKIDVRLETNTKYVLIEVVDNGLGIPKNAQKEIFNKFYRAENIKDIDTKGTGLGLYLVKSLVDHYNGKIWFVSKESLGSSFYVKLPLRV